MKVFGIALVRNEVDIIGLTIDYHLGLGLDRILIIDNGSTDGTSEILRERARHQPVSWTQQDSGFHQAALTTNLARQAFHEGADWVLPFDADEFWFAPYCDFRDLLLRTSAGALHASVLHYIQSRDQRDPAPDALLSMTRRARNVAYPHYDFFRLLDSRQIAFVETLYPPKFICRPTADVEIGDGNHQVTNIRGPVQATADLVCLHAPLRSRAHIARKAETGRRHDQVGYPNHRGLYARRFNQIEMAGAIDQEWAANSYADESLNVYGTPHPVAFDPTLRDAVAPFIQPTDSRTGVHAHASSAEAPEALPHGETTTSVAQTTSARLLAQDVVNALFHRVTLLEELNRTAASWGESLTLNIQRAEQYARDVEAGFQQAERHVQAVEAALEQTAQNARDVEAQALHAEAYARAVEAQHQQTLHQMRSLEEYVRGVEEAYRDKVQELQQRA
ncbi:MAG: hypothetical protein PVSMB7_11430 [Chloroflexota bacterium]